jgi:predicted amidohydrolase YtcJ
LLEPYRDNPDYVGDTMLTVEELRDFLIELHNDRFDLHIHTIGDLAARRVLDSVEAAKQEVGSTFYPRVTVSHIELVDPADVPRFAELGIIVNFTPRRHGVDVGSVVTPAFGAERMARTYTAKPLFDAGALVSFSSDDWTLDALSPFLGMQVGHNRQYPRERPADAEDRSAYRLPESEKLDLKLMVRGYTINGAHQFRLENQIGSIEVGKLADLVVLDDNLFEMDRYEIHKIKPSAVMMEGELIHGELPMPPGSTRTLGAPVVDVVCRTGRLAICSSPLEGGVRLQWVCGLRRDGQWEEYKNACDACTDSFVLGYRVGRCR